MPFVAIDKDGTELITQDFPKVCIEYNEHTSGYETSLYGEEAIKFNALSQEDKIKHVMFEYSKNPFKGKHEHLHKEVMEKLHNNELHFLSEMSYKQNRYLRPIALPNGTIKKLIGKDLIFGDEPFEIK